MSSWNSYPSIFNLGHRAVKDLLNYPHYVEEKIDGSQFSFGVFESEDFLEYYEKDGKSFASPKLELKVRSKGAVMVTDAPEKMFNKAVESVKERVDLLHPGWTYRAEFLAKPKHNTLAYDRVPAGHLAIFDVSTGDSDWLDPEAKAAEAARIGLECVPVLHWFGPLSASGPASLVILRDLLDTQKSVLGGQLIEGVVIKPLVELYGPDHKTLMGKFVSERFKEAHRENWKVTSPSSRDIVDMLIKKYKVEGRWLKAVQHLREAGQLQDAPQDIPNLIREVQKDLGQECKEEIMHLLWKWAWPHVSRAVTGGLPEWWKEQLLKKQFEVDDGTEQSNDVTAG